MILHKFNERQKFTHTKTLRNNKHKKIHTRQILIKPSKVKDNFEIRKREATFHAQRFSIRLTADFLSEATEWADIYF